MIINMRSFEPRPGETMLQRKEVTYTPEQEARKKAALSTFDIYFFLFNEVVNSGSLQE